MIFSCHSTHHRAQRSESRLGRAVRRLGGAITRSALTRWLMTSVVAGVAVVVTSAPAHAAHAELKSISPAHNSTLSSPLKQVVLTFSQPVNTRFTVVRVSGPDGVRVATGTPRIKGAVVTVRPEPLTVAGRYRVAYRTVSVDGHPVSGSRRFTLAPSGVASATPTASPAATPSSAAPSTVARARPGGGTVGRSSGLGWGTVLGGTGAVLVAVVGIGAALRRRRAG